MKLTRFYSDGELSSISVSSETETVEEVKGLFFIEQLIEESILLELRVENKEAVSDVDEIRLDFDRIYSKKELKKKAFRSFMKIVDSSEVEDQFSMDTVLEIKWQQKNISAIFRNYVVLQPKGKLFGNSAEPMLFATLKNGNYYWMNPSLSEEKNKFSFKVITNWIKNAIFSKTSSK